MRKYFLFLAALAAASAAGQQPVPVGGGSYAEYAPLFKSKTDQHGGDKSRIMETRKIYVADSKRGEPMPTNDWWTNLLVDTYSGNLWVYPQVVKAEGYGIFVAKPSHWSSDGCEMKFDTRLTVKGRKFRPAEAAADDWSDWGLRMRLADGDKRMNVTMAQGVPFTWIEPDGLDLIIDLGGGEPRMGGNPVAWPAETDRLVVKIGDDIYGIYAPDGTLFDEEDGDVSVTFAEGRKPYLSIAILPDEEAADAFAAYASVVPRQTTVAWSYDERAGKMTSTWHIDTENLDGESSRDVLQGFLPHHYKNSENDLRFLGYTYATPRGSMKMAAGTDFTTTYRFSGILPWFAAPEDMPGLSNPYDRERMRRMIADYAAKGGFGADTYWGGKGLTQMALYMTFAKEMGEEELFEQCRSRLRGVMEDWLTYTPGETSYFFARFPRWGALVGYDTSYDSDTFNDHHFHYGYFTYAGALLALVDPDFKAKYGEMLRLVAKDYANWERADKRFPLFRTFCPWSGHSYAGGLGNTGNGNGQESTSEAMQGWGGMYLLGVALGDKQMRDAGIFGWVTESKGVAEYWFDRDKENIDRSLYTKPYNSNLTAAGIGWWTWFSGDPVWMHSIQWMPISPCLDYLSEDLDFARWDYEQMWAGKEIAGWETSPDFAGSALSKESGLGNVVLSYLQRFDPDTAAEVFDDMWNAEAIVARNTDTNGITYYITHSHRTYGDRDFSLHADMPTASAYAGKDGTYTYVVYNADPSEKEVSFYRDGAKVVSFKAPAGRLTVYQEAPVPSSIAISSPGGLTVPPGTSVKLSAAVLDQYGATMDGQSVTWRADAGGTVDADGTFRAGVENRERCVVTAASGGLEGEITLRVGPAPVLTEAKIMPDIRYAMAGDPIAFSLSASDQYGDRYPLELDWAIERDGLTVKTDSILDLDEIGVYTVKAASSDGHVYTHEVYVTPQMENLALHKPVSVSSEENAGTLKGNATDGDAQSRWSSAATDDEWIYVDLGRRMFVSAVCVNWEAAYATRYEVQISDDAGHWITAADVNGGGGMERTSVGKDARYVRLLLKNRATAYGYSLYELEVYGVDPDSDPAELMGIGIQAPRTLLKAGEPVELEIVGYDGTGGKVPVADALWSVADAFGTITQGGVYTPAGYGTAEVSVSAAGKTASAKFVVEEAIMATSAELTPSKAELAKGSTLEFRISATDQFSVPCGADGFTLSCPSDPDLVSGNVFSALRNGTYEVVASNGTVSAKATVKVCEFADVNLALGKDVYASSYENDQTLPEFANDGDISTRWGSEFADDQYLVVDLGAAYVLNRAVIHWNAGAYSTDYRIEVSEDEDTWTTAAAESASSGGDKVYAFAPVAGRYVRVTCMKRANGYGSCVDEIEIYGTSRYENPRPQSVKIEGGGSLEAFVGTPLKLQAVLTDQYGIDCSSKFHVDWEVEGDCAEIAADGTLTPVKAGTATVVARCGSLEARASVCVLDAKETVSLLTEPAYMELEAGTAAEIAVLSVDQYGVPSEAVGAVWICPDGVSVDNGRLTAVAAGIYEVEARLGNLSATTSVRVIPPLTDNIALKKPTAASAGEGSMTAVNDGDGGSRWISDAQDDAPVWIEIDLQGFYHLMRSSIVWERAAAADYELQVSADRRTWTPVAVLSDMPDTETSRTDDAAFSAVCRYARVYCTRRATAWNYSIFEWRLFGRLMEQGEPCTVVLTKAPESVAVEESCLFDAEARDCDGDPLSDAQILWRSTGGNILSDGSYSSLLLGTFQITASAGLASAATTVEVTGSTSGVVSTLPGEPHIRISAAGGLLTVEAAGLRSVSVYAASGVCLLRKDGLGGDNYTQSTALPKGVYIVVVESESGKKVEKIIL